MPGPAPRAGWPRGRIAIATDRSDPSRSRALSTRQTICLIGAAAAALPCATTSTCRTPAAREFQASSGNTILHSVWCHAACPRERRRVRRPRHRPYPCQGAEACPLSKRDLCRLPRNVCNRKGDGCRCGPGRTCFRNGAKAWHPATARKHGTRLPLQRDRRGTPRPTTTANAEQGTLNVQRRMNGNPPSPRLRRAGGTPPRPLGCARGDRWLPRHAAAYMSGAPPMACGGTRAVTSVWGRGGAKASGGRRGRWRGGVGRRACAGSSPGAGSGAHTRR